MSFEQILTGTVIRYPYLWGLSRAFFLPLLREFVARRSKFTQVNRLR